MKELNDLRDYINALSDNELIDIEIKVKLEGYLDKIEFKILDHSRHWVNNKDEE